MEVNMVKRFRYYKRIVKDSPDEYGLPTDEDLEAEYKAKLESIRKQREEAKAKKESELKEEKELKTKYARDLKIIRNANSMEDLYELVPVEGKADTLAGELVRAFMRVEYRWHNDGDIFFEGYGYTDTCSAPMAFIAKNTNLTDDIWDYADDISSSGEPFDYDDIGYDHFLDNLKANLYDEIKDAPGLFMKPTKDMYDTDGESYFERVVPVYDYTVDIPYNISDREFTERDIESFFDFNVLGGVHYSDVYMDYRKSYVTIEGLNSRDYEELDSYDWDDIWNDFEENYLEPEEPEESEESEEE